MQGESVPVVARRLEKYVLTLPSAKKLNMLSSEPRKAMMALSDSTASLKVYCERYFNADDSQEQKVFLEQAIELAKETNDNILAAGQHDLLGPADVAHLSALAEHIRERLI
ncbi:MAG: hypothetical protein M3Q14_02800 [bacterium]|nr:hypothetical protein [bacterium]